jgi:hypothetical protein
MKKNVGSIDKIFRIVAGVVIGTGGIYFQSWWGLIAIIPIATAFISWCPLYSVFGMNTNQTKS